MTDYLSRLAARSIDAGKVILPRLPGLFESTTNGPLTERSEGFGVLETSRLRSSETRPLSLDPNQEKMPVGEIIGNDRLIDREETRASKYGIKMMNEYGIGDAPGIASVETNQVRRPKHSTENPVEASVNVATVRPVGITAQVHQRKPGNDSFTASNQDNVMLEDPDDRARSLDAENRIKPKAFDIASGRTLPGSHTITPARMSHAGPLPKMQDQLISASMTIPTIKINIGRIEVRAVAQPLPPKPVSAKTSPKLSLEEYSKQRHGGRA